MNAQQTIAAFVALAGEVGLTPKLNPPDLEGRYFAFEDRHIHVALVVRKDGTIAFGEMGGQVISKKVEAFFLEKNIRWVPVHHQNVIH